MTRVVYKYSIDLRQGVDPVLEIPGGGQFLTLKLREIDDPYGVGTPSRSNIVDTWWLVDPSSVPVEVQLHIRGTGDDVPPSVNYLDTMFAGSFVFHIFQKDRVFEDMHIVDGVFVPKSQ